MQLLLAEYCYDKVEKGLAENHPRNEREIQQEAEYLHAQYRPAQLCPHHERIP
jgi:hypothetical protein